MGLLSVWTTPMCSHLFVPWRGFSGVNSIFRGDCSILFILFILLLLLLLFFLACDGLHVTERTHARLQLLFYSRHVHTQRS